MPASTLAPATLANTPAPTSLSKAAIVVTGERNISATTNKSGIPNSILANTWGSSSTSFVNRLERSNLKLSPDARLNDNPSPLLLPSGSPPKPASLLSNQVTNHTISAMDLSLPPTASRSRTPSPIKRHRNTISFDAGSARQTRAALNLPEFPNYYPLQLKTQDAQFRLLFPNVRLEERLVIVFRATWNPNDQQEFPGRVYVTTKDIYFYSNHFGLVLTSGVSLSSVDEVTAAPGKDCDFLFIHLKEGSADSGATRITIKTFLEPLGLLQRRLNFLVRNSTADEPHRLEDVIKVLLKMESEVPERSPSLASWEDVAPDTPMDSFGQRNRARASTIGTELKAPLRIDRALHTGIIAQGENATKFKLPAQPVKYTPPGNLTLSVEKEFDVSPKALFHVMFGDKSALFQLLQHERRARNLKQGPWVNMGEGRPRRDFEFDVSTTNVFGRETMTQVHDYQFVDVNSDHLCYVVTDKRTPWHLPFRASHRLVSKIVITHVAKGRCKLAVFVKVEWLHEPWIAKGIIERQALHDLELDAQDLADLISDQVRKLGAYSRTKKAIQIFGQLGQLNEITQLQIDKSAMHIELRRNTTPRSMTGLLTQGASLAAQSAAGSTLDALLNVFKWLAKMCSAHAIILSLLVLSAIFNTWHTSRDTLGWWHERNAAKFMHRIGVVPNQVMSKAIYVADLDEMLLRSGNLPARESSTCYTVFHDHHALNDVDAPQRESGRLAQTRQKLGQYRHDLLVAMRVVNRIETEVVKSEWEEWVAAENRRCRQVKGLVGPITNGTDDAKEGVMQKVVGGKIAMDKEVQKWYKEYCSSCGEEARTVAIK